MAAASSAADAATLAADAAAAAADTASSVRVLDAGGGGPLL